ncbi:MAG: GNAT family N-acetyltransferase [Eubacterium sp.]|uniref:GNAT family N-acetyltransferase n=1 Tax=Eubacterium sp. TaxID=142586 RepID=UPI0025C2F77C|nr:GNAT family N-acetyltransferase [Eubacterium sp.]
MKYSGCLINRGQSKSMILIDITNENLRSYKQFENCFDNLSSYLSRIYPDFDAKIKWCYINVDNKNIGGIWLEKVNVNTVKLGVFIADEKYRNKGYGTFAINEIIRFAKNLGYKSVVLNVRISNIKAFNVYLNIGFKETKRFTKSNGVDVIKMEYVI